MNFLIVDPRRKTVTPVACAALDDAIRASGLVPGHVDHGTIEPRLHIVVGQYSLFVPARAQDFFAIGRRLYAGPAVIYATDKEGFTISIEYDGRWFGRWFGSYIEAEFAITINQMDRPQIAVGNRVFWRWPAPRPDMDEIAKALAAAPGDVVIDGDTVIRKLPG